jgi:hypothetical protein
MVNKNDYEKRDNNFLTPSRFSLQWSAHPLFYNDDCYCLPDGSRHAGNFICGWKEFFQLVVYERGSDQGRRLG